MPKAQSLDLDLVAQIGKFAREQNPDAYSDLSDAEIGAHLLVQNQGATHALFQSSNETDDQGKPVIAPDPVQAAWTKAATIGAPGLGEHYVPPTTSEILTSDNPFKALYQAAAAKIVGPGRPASVVKADPYGIQAAFEGKGPMPMFMGSTAEVGPEVAEAVRSVKGTPLRGQALGALANTIEPGETSGIYVLRQPTVDRLQHLSEIGTSLPSTSNWAGAKAEELLRAFNGDRAAAIRWARMWGATSPNTSVPVNTRESISALLHVLENPGVPFTEELAQNLPEGKITMAGSKYGNLNAAVEGRVLSPDMKAEAMSGYMIGDPRIPLDVHAMYALGTDATKFDPEISALRKLMTNAEGLPFRGGLTDPEIYKRYETAVRNAIQGFDPERTVNPIFGDLWEGARAHKGLKPQGGPIDILRKKGLLELGAMLDPDRLRAALRQSGWTAGAIAGLMATLDGAKSTDETPSGTGME